MHFAKDVPQAEKANDTTNTKGKLVKLDVALNITFCFENVSR